MLLVCIRRLSFFSLFGKSVAEAAVVAAVDDLSGSLSPDDIPDAVAIAQELCPSSSSSWPVPLWTIIYGSSSGGGGGGRERMPIRWCDSLCGLLLLY